MKTWDLIRGPGTSSTVIFARVHVSTMRVVGFTGDHADARSSAWRRGPKQRRAPSRACGRIVVNAHGRPRPAHRQGTQDARSTTSRARRHLYDLRSCTRPCSGRERSSPWAIAWCRSSRRRRRHVRCGLRPGDDAVDPPATPPSVPAPTTTPPTRRYPKAAETQAAGASPAALRLPPPTPPLQQVLILGGRPRAGQAPQPEPPAAVRWCAADCGGARRSVHRRAARRRAHAGRPAPRAGAGRASRGHGDAPARAPGCPAARPGEADATQAGAPARRVRRAHRAEAARGAGRRDPHHGAAADSRPACSSWPRPTRHTRTPRSRSSPNARRAPTARRHDGPARRALLERRVQREASEAVAENIDALTSIVADLGHTVGMQAVAAAQKPAAALDPGHHPAAAAGRARPRARSARCRHRVRTRGTNLRVDPAACPATSAASTPRTRELRAPAARATNRTDTRIRKPARPPTLRPPRSPT